MTAKYARELAKRQARADMLAESVGDLAATLAEARLVVMDEALTDGAKARLAAKQIENLIDVRRDVTSALLAGKIDPSTASTAERAITAMVADLRWFAERLDSQQWGAKQDVNVNMKVSVDQLTQRLAAGRNRVIEGQVVRAVIEQEHSDSHDEAES